MSSYLYPRCKSQGTHTICLGSRLCIVVLLPQKRFFERFWMNLSSPLTVIYNRRTREETLFWKGSSAGAIFPQKNRIAPLSNFAAYRSKDSRFFSYLPIENPSKRPGASPRRKSKSHGIWATGMRSKIHTCQPQTVPLIAPFWLDDVRP